MGIIRLIRTKKKRNSPNDYNVTVTVGDDPNNQVKTVEVTIREVGEQPTPEPPKVVLTYQSMEGEDRVFSTDTLGFSENAVGYVYPMTAVMKNSKGGKIGSSSTQDVTIEEEEGEGA